MKAYKTHQQVLSRHCNSTGIVAFSQYHDLAQEAVERWFDEALDWSFARMQGGERLAVPVVRAASSFPSASRLGDHLVWRLHVENIGSTSMDLSLLASCGGDARVEMTLTVVLSETDVMRTRRWPDEIRARAEDYKPRAVAE